MAKKRHRKGGRPPPSGAGRPAAVATRPLESASRTSAKPPKVAARSAAVTARRPWYRRREVIAGIVAGVIILAVVIGAYLLFRSGRLGGPPAGAETGSDLAGVQVPDEGRNHVPEGSAITYRTNPPASGPHYPVPKDWGVYTDPVAPGYWVHNLEHGGVVVLYDCPSGCPSVVDGLRQAYATFPKDKFGEVKLIVTPYSGLPDHAPIMAVAWDYQKTYSSLDLSQLLAFYNAHVDRGPEDVP